MKNHDPLLDLLLKSARPDAPPDDALPPRFVTRIAARWAAGGEPETLLARLWERLALRAALAYGAAALMIGWYGAAALMIGWACHGSLPDARRAAREASAQEIELVQIEELFWTP